MLPNKMNLKQVLCFLGYCRRYSLFRGCLSGRGRCPARQDVSEPVVASDRHPRGGGSPGLGRGGGLAVGIPVPGGEAVPVAEETGAGGSGSRGSSGRRC